MRRRYLLSALVAAVVIALVVGCIGMLLAGRPSPKLGDLATTGSEHSADAVTPTQFGPPTRGGSVSLPAVDSGSASVSSSSSTGGVLVKARGFRLTADGCYESDPAVEGDPPGIERLHKVDIDECRFLRDGTPAGFDSR
jgi:hypothetical protein